MAAFPTKNDYFWGVKWRYHHLRKRELEDEGKFSTLILQSQTSDSNLAMIMTFVFLMLGIRLRYEIPTTMFHPLEFLHCLESQPKRHEKIAILGRGV